MRAEGETFVPGDRVAGRARLCEQPLPPYSYVSGFAPHPVTDPAGHLHGALPAASPPLVPSQWRSSAEYLYGIDLFNHGYYWESHEVWEGLWHAAGRHGTQASFLKALIKLAAAGVKAREGKPPGVARHAARAAELLTEVQSETEGEAFAGFRLEELLAFARHWQASAALMPTEPDPQAVYSSLPNIT